MIFGLGFRKDFPPRVSKLLKRHKMFSAFQEFLEAEKQHDIIYFTFLEKKKPHNYLSTWLSVDEFLLVAASLSWQKWKECRGRPTDHASAHNSTNWAGGGRAGGERGGTQRPDPSHNSATVAQIVPLWTSRPPPTLVSNTILGLSSPPPSTWNLSPPWIKEPPKKQQNNAGGG